MAAGLVKHSSATLDAAFEKSLTEENLSLADNEEINYDLASAAPCESGLRSGVLVPANGLQQSLARKLTNDIGLPFSTHIIQVT